MKIRIETIVSMIAVLMSFGVLAKGSDIAFVKIGDPGNAAHSSGHGSVDYVYNIGKYEVTTAQYTEFLNAVAKTDPRALWNANQSIGRAGSSGSYVYTVTSGFENRPMDFVQLRDMMRFVNWLHNGQPTGDQGTTTTEDGVYFLNGGDPNHSTVRKTDWKYALPNVDEWYKAAYYNRATTSYYTYPTSSNTAPGHTYPDDGNNASYASPPLYNQESDMRDVGSYVLSKSPYGTFDQAGNAWERTETIVSTAPDTLTTINIGGSWNAAVNKFHADTAADATMWHWRALDGYGFRIVAKWIPSGTLVTVR